MRHGRFGNGKEWDEVINGLFWKGRKVFLTGHTGFKGSWISLWLHSLGAEVTGYSLEPATNPSLFELSKLNNKINSIIGDIRDLSKLENAIVSSNPDIVIHMAAQPLVKESYVDPVLTYSTNVMGTVNLFQAIRKCKDVRAVINITTDKCYENKEWAWGYRENESLGGYDPYSNSKACSELITSSYRSSFFNPENYNDHGLAIATARAGNVIGGGDWAKDRLIPDCIQSLLEKKEIIIRNPYSVRPWQHVLEPLSGYLILAEKLYLEGPKYGEAWNFGPQDKDAKSVEWIVNKLCEKWGTDCSYKIDINEHPHEAHFLKLDCSKANMNLHWSPRWGIDKALDKIIDWTNEYKTGNAGDFSRVCLQQIKEYTTGAEIIEG